MSVAEKLTIIAENVPKVFEAGYQAGSSAGGTIDESLFANALKRTTSGVSIFLEDASPFAHTAKVKLSSKNLHPSLVGLLFYDDSEDQNITITETDGHPTINGTYTHNDYNDGYLGDGDTFELEGGKTYTLSVKRFGGEITEGALTLTLMGKTFYLNMSITNDQPEGVPQSFVAPGDGSACITFAVDDGTVFDNFTFDVQVEEGATATAYTPLIADPTVATVVVRGDGKNLFNPNTIPEETAYEGVILTRNGDEISLSAPSDAEGVCGEMLEDYPPCLYLPDLVGEELVLTVYGAKDIGGDWDVFIYTSDRSDDGFELLSGPRRFTLDKPYLKLVFWLDVTGQWDETFTIQLEQGKVSSEYEPYTFKAYSVAEDGTCEVPVTVNTVAQITTDTPGVSLACEYAQDTNKVIEKLINAIISMGGNV